ncbi:MAG: threonine--tRNA ligase [Candidatus Micrarchaeota archaeon]
MRIVMTHADFIEIEPKQKAIKNAEKVEMEKKRYEELLVVFSAVEASDENIEEIAKKTASEIDSVAKQVKVQNVLIYPFVHFTSKPATPKTAFAVLEKIVENMNTMGYNARRAPFGWYKAYTLKCKGHPLSELSREITITEAGAALALEANKERASRERANEEKADKEKVTATVIGDEENIPTSLRAEEKMKSRFYILDLDGNLHDADKFDYAKNKNKNEGKNENKNEDENEKLGKVALYEMKKVRVYETEPPHIKLMKEHKLVDYEPGSDSGNFRWCPKGRLMKKILERAITNFCVDYGAIEVETPIMYDFEHPSLKKYLNRFPARQYVVLSDDKKFFLRFSACFGQFLISHDMIISYKQLPLKIYELTRYSFRREQGGELAGLKRLRAFTMPDMHTMAASMEQAKLEVEGQIAKSLEWNKNLGLDIEVAFRAQTDFFNENKEWYVSLAKKIGKAVLLELFDERYAYFITKFDFNFVDAVDKASALGTVQIDVENAETYDISYVDEKGQKKRPYILHTSFSGAIERVIYALLEKEAMRMKNGKKGMFPLWLAPTQLRIIPIGERHLAFANELLERGQLLGLHGLPGRRVRADIDNSGETLGKKIRNAEMEWCPYIAVIGDKEIESGKLAVTIRESGEKKEMLLEEVLSEIEKKTEGMVFEQISFGKTTGSRPVI